MATINLVKGQKINLKKDNGTTLTTVTMGLGWDAVSTWIGSSSSIDLDASCLLFDASGNLVDQVWFRQLKSNDGSIVHSGDRMLSPIAVM